MRALVAALVLTMGLLALAPGSVTAAESATASSKAASGSATVASSAAAARQRARMNKQIRRFRERTWHWQKVIGARPTPTSRTEKRTASAAYRRWVHRLWQRRAKRIWKRVQRVPNKTRWLCIHRYEGSWTANTGNGYYGGLQMDISFQRTYGYYLLKRKGTANRWTPHEQMWVAERARRSGRGYYPWPNTARYCGLI